LSPEAYRMIRANVSGQRPFGDFRNLTQFSGFAPSAGADQIANYLLLEARRVGLANAEIERFPSDGKTYVWAFRTEPYWEAHRAELWLEGPHGEQTTFAFSLSNRVGESLRKRLAAGEPLVVQADVEADIGNGEYPEVRAEIPGQDPRLPAVLVYAHTNDRNAGGGNNLTGV